MNINSPKFWQKVKREYIKNNTYFIFFCFCSDSFSKEYGKSFERRYHIIKNAQEFIVKYNIKNFKVTESVLFCSDEKIETESVKIRLKFINYMIKKLSK